MSSFGVTEYIMIGVGATFAVLVVCIGVTAAIMMARAPSDIDTSSRSRSQNRRDISNASITFDERRDSMIGRSFNFPVVGNGNNGNGNGNGNGNNNDEDKDNDKDNDNQRRCSIISKMSETGFDRRCSLISKMSETGFNNMYGFSGGGKHDDEDVDDDDKDVCNISNIIESNNTNSSTSSPSEADIEAIPL